MAIICTSEPAGPTDVKHPNGFVTSKLPRTSLRLPRVSWLLLLPVEKNDRLRLSTTEHSSKRTIPPLSMPCRKRPFPQRFLMFVPSLAGLNDRFYIKMAQKKARFSHLGASQLDRRRELAMRNAIFFEFSLCLSRACLGKMTHFIYKWRKKWRF